MKRFLQLYIIEQKLALRSGDMLIFGVAMPVGVMILINMIAGQKQAGAGFTYLDSSFASLIAVGICAAAFMGIPLTIADYRDKKILKHFFTTPCSPMWILGSDMLCAGGTALLSAMSVAFVSVVFLGYEMKGNVLAFMGSWLLTLVSMFSIGLLGAMLEVGLPYLSLGQPLSTLSGGERQRVKLAKDLYKKGNIYVLDEPTTGLHASDIKTVMELLDRLVDRGNKSVLRI